MSHNYYNPIMAQGKIVGKVAGDTFYKTIRANHYLKFPPSIAFDISTLDQAEQAGAVWVEVRDKDNGTTYRSTIEHIREKGTPFNRGWGDQIYLPLDGWMRSKKGAGLQLSFMGGAS
jgi:hypothetical protein